MTGIMAIEIARQYLHSFGVGRSTELGLALDVDRAIGLLEGDAGGERQRPMTGIMAIEIARQNLHSFGVGRSTELGLALDVDHLAVPMSGARPHARRDARRQPEGEAARAQH